MPTIPGGYSYGDKIMVIAGKRLVFKNGDVLDKGMMGSVIGVAAVGDGQDDWRVKVRLDGNKGPTNLFISDLQQVLEPKEKPPPISADKPTTAGGMGDTPTPTDLNL